MSKEQPTKEELIAIAVRKGNEDLALAIAAQPLEVQDKEKKWIPNKFFNMLFSSFGRVDANVKALVEDGLSYGAGDFYVYEGRGGIKVHETPKGVRKQLQKIAAKYGLSIIVSDGVLYAKDRLSVKTDGRIDEIEIYKDSEDMVKGGVIVAPYAVVTVFRGGNEIIAKKIFIIPQKEYAEILKKGTGSSYPTMMAQKSVMKRVANGIYSLLGVSIGKDDSLDEMEKRLEDESPRQSEDEPTKQPDPLAAPDAVDIEEV